MECWSDDKENKNLCERYIHILNSTLVVVKNYPETNFRKVILREKSGE